MFHRAASFSLPEEVLQQLRDEATAQKRPVSWIVRDALASYLLCADRQESAENGNAEVSPDGDA